MRLAPPPAGQDAALPSPGRPRLCSHQILSAALTEERWLLSYNDGHYLPIGRTLWPTHDARPMLSMHGKNCGCIAFAPWETAPGLLSARPHRPRRRGLPRATSAPEVGRGARAILLFTMKRRRPLQSTQEERHAHVVFVFDENILLEGDLFERCCANTACCHPPASARVRRKRVSAREMHAAVIILLRGLSTRCCHPTAAP